MARDLQKFPFRAAVRTLRTDERLTAEQIKVFIRRVYTSPWVRRTFDPDGAFPPLEINIATYSGAYYGSAARVVILCEDHFTKLDALYYLSYLLGAESPSPKHGPVRARRFLFLVQHYLGVEPATRLRAAFKQEGVKYSKPKVLTDEQRLTLKIRALTMRASNPKVTGVRRRMIAPVAEPPSYTDDFLERKIVRRIQA